jgi:hypothetical protein
VGIITTWIGGADNEGLLILRYCTAIPQDVTDQNRVERLTLPLFHLHQYSRLKTGDEQLDGALL